MKWWHRLAAFVLVLLAAAATWFPTWDEPYAEDDYLFLDAALDLAPSDVLDYFTGEGVMDHHVRPLSDPLFFVALRALAGTNPIGYHVALFALHFASALLLVLLGIRLGFGPAAAWFAGAIYVTRDFTYPSLVWASGVSDIGSGFFAFVSFAAFATYLARGGFLWRILALVAFIAALLVKETAIVALGLAMLLAWRLRTASGLSTGGRAKRVLAATWPFLVVAAPITATQALRANFESAGKELYALGLSTHALTVWPAYVVWSIAGVKELLSSRAVNVALIAVAYAALGALAIRWRRGASGTGFLVAWFFVALAPALLAPHRVLTNYLVLGGAAVSWALGVGIARLGGFSPSARKPSLARRAGALVALGALVAIGPILVAAKDRGRFSSGGWVNVVHARAMARTVEEIRTVLPEPEAGSNLLVFGTSPFDVRVLGNPRREGFAPRQVLPSALRVAYGRTDLDAVSLPPIAQTSPDLMAFVRDLVGSERTHVLRAGDRVVDATAVSRRAAELGTGPDELRRLVAGAR